MKRAVLVDGFRDSLEAVVAHLRAGFPVGMPTETVYGLAANAMDASACRRIFEVKGRPLDNPLIVHISDISQLDSAELGLVRLNEDGSADLPMNLKQVLDKFWPGPLTVLLPKGPKVSDVVTAGQPTVAVRFPSHPIAQRLIGECGFPLAAPSANKSGRPSPTMASHVMYDLGMELDFVVDGGACEVGLESTVLDCTRTPPRILRPGGITLAMLRELLPDVCMFGSVESEGEMEEMLSRPSTPGMKYRHYAPDRPLHLFHQCSEAQISGFIEDQLKQHRLVVRICSSVDALTADAAYERIFLSRTGRDLAEIAHNLFAALREADEKNPDVIVCEAIDEGELSESLGIMNRLSKAATVHHVANDLGLQS